MFFFSVGEAATSKWTHGEVAVFGSTVYKIFALKCQKLRTPLASLAPCVININKFEYCYTRAGKLSQLDRLGSCNALTSKYIFIVRFKTNKNI